ncbi:MAG: FMN-binding protein [Treponema sp.]|nr:FMN-binding protein [Treponema sp.]
MILWFFLIALCVSCAGKSSSLKDGYYTAEAAQFDEYGWKEYVTVRIADGKITLVEYNAFNSAGFIKSWDMDYMRVMNARNGTHPNAYTRYYGQRLLENQGTEGVECISGATTSYNMFLALADTALENARQGNANTSLVTFSGNGHDEENQAR